MTKRPSTADIAGLHSIGPAKLPRWNSSPQEESNGNCSVADLQTPCYILYRSILERNAQRMLDRAAHLGCMLRPHMKTHKTLQAGTICTGGTRRRVVVSTLAEAQFFADGGFDDIIYAVPITADKLPLAAALTLKLQAFHITLDHPEALEAVLHRAPAKGKPWSVFLMMDCGYGRDGVDPTDPASVSMARRLTENSEVASFAGIYTHGGHSYDHEGAENDVVVKVRETAKKEAQAAVEFGKRLREAGIDVPVVGIGSTPTCSNPPLEGLEGVDEMHPGNYCYYDVMQERLGSCKEEDIAVRVVTRVIGHYPKKNLLLVDMGWTACSKQGEACGFGRIEGHPELTVANLKQEAGLLKSTDGQPLDFTRYPLGTQLRLEPYHSCAHTKQHDRIHVLADDRNTVTDTWAICRGW